MADDGLLVTISGAATSLLFYENVRKSGDQIGFLTGEVSKYITKNVTDADRQVVSTKTHVDIQGVIPCPSHSPVYNSFGKVNIEDLNDLTQKKCKVIGWYRFRFNSSLKPTLRDKILHKQFEELFSRNYNMHTFLLCMINYTSTPSGSTHKFRHVLLRYKNGVYRPISLRINNLAADATRHDGSDYKPTPIRHPDSEKSYFTKLLETVKINSNMAGSEKIKLIQHAAENRLQKLVSDVYESDKYTAQLEEQVNKYQKLLYEKNNKLSEDYSNRESHNCCKMRKVKDENNKLLSTEISMDKDNADYDNKKKSSIPMSYSRVVANKPENC